MNSFLNFYLLVYAGLFSYSGDSDGDTPIQNTRLQVTHLKTEMLSNPEGIGEENPGLSWQIRAEERGVVQEAFQVLVASTLDKLTENEADLWNSGKNESSESIHVKYAGKSLKSRQKCFWKVRVWTNKGVTEWSEPAYFSIGMLHYKDWWGRWIGFDKPFPWESVEKFPTLGARYLRKEFEIEKEIKSATAYIIGLGLYEMHINGEKVGNAVLAPTPTDYIENVKYNAFDVTSYLQSSAPNAIGVALGNGRYFTMRPNYKPYKIADYGFPKMLFHMEINFSDGTKQIVWSDNKWKGTADGPIRNNNEYDGELYDARKEFAGWTNPGFDDTGWLEVDYVQEPGGEYEAQMNSNMKVMQEVRPVSISRLSADKHILDMGQNMVGWLEMRVKGERGDSVVLRFAESLEESGELFMTNLRDARVTDTYILKGGETEVWEPTFTYHGFRYVEVTGYPGKPAVEDFTGKMVYDDMQTIGSFETSDPTINQIYNNAWWGIAGNYKGMPVDCPQRNERQPWLGDRAVGSYGESFMFDNTSLYTKWLEDIRYAQKADGSIPDVAPAFWRYYSDNMTWPGTMILITDMLYRQRGDVTVIQENYDAMKKWLQYMKDRYMDENYIVTKDSYGDWCVPPPSIEEGRGKNADVKRPSRLISTTYYYYFMDLMSNLARLTGNEADISGYQLLKEKIGEAFNNTYYVEAKGYYGDNKMTDNLLPLYFGMVKKENEERVFANLVETIEVKNNGHLSTGVVGTQWLMRTLTEYGRPDLAYQIATNRTYPSWGYMLENGATTIWELWHGNVANPKMNSQNHVMLLGDLIVWFYESLAGIKAAEPGFSKIRMKPLFDLELDYVKASHTSMYGLIESEWKKGDDMLWKVTIPTNTVAEIYFPAGTEVIENGRPISKSEGVKLLAKEKDHQVYQLASGSYSFDISSYSVKQ